MFSIFNGRTSFYQWDVDQKLIINCDIPDYHVHFENTSDEVCYTLEPYEMDGKTVVNVPNILLQNFTPIIVWIYVLDKNGNYTIKSKTFAVIKRQKPSDYVYTETEVLSFNSKLDKNVGAENAGKALVVAEDGNIVFENTNKNSNAVLYTEQNLTAAQQKQARTNIDVAGYNVINYLWPTEHSGREATDITTLLENDVYMGIVKNSTAFPSPGLVMLQGPMAGNVYTAVLLAKDGLTYTATFQYVRSTKHFALLIPVAPASSKLISVKLTRPESGENVYTADRNIIEIEEALQAGHMVLAYTPNAAGLQNSVGLITSCVRTERSGQHFVTVLGCFDTVLSSTQWQVGADGITWTVTFYAEYATRDWVTYLENAMPKPVGKTDTMTQAVGMDETGKLWTQPGASGGGGETWEKIAEIVIPEGADESTALAISKDSDGNPFSLVKARLCAKFPKYTGTTGIPNFSFAMLNGKTTGRVTSLAYTSAWPKVSASNVTGMVYEIDVSGAQQIEHVIRTTTRGWADDSSRDYVVYGAPNSDNATWFADTLWAKPITSIGGAGMLIYPGCRFVLYGVRA